MLFKSALVTQVSGSIGGLVGSHNKGGYYFRARAVPTDPATTPQEVVRAAVAYLSNRWVNDLTQAQRSGWDQYASQVTITNPLGDEREISGMNHYIRSNVPRIQSTLLPIVDDAPSLFSLAGFTEISSPTANASTNGVAFAFNNADTWANTDDSGMIVWISRPQNPSIQYFKGPYQFATFVPGNSTTPPESPAAAISNFPFIAGQKIFWRVAVSLDDGRYSNTQRVSAIAT